MADGAVTTRFRLLVQEDSRSLTSFPMMIVIVPGRLQLCLIFEGQARPLYNPIALESTMLIKVLRL